MLLSKANLLVRKVASADKSDPVIHQVHIGEDGSTVASNGHALMAVSPVQEKPAAFPDMDADGEVPDGGVGVKLQVIDETTRNMPRGALALELGFAKVTKCDDARKSIELTTTDLNVQRRVAGSLQRHRFPEWQAALRNVARRSRFRVCLDRKEMVRLLQAIDAACPDPDNAVFIEFGESPGEDGLLLRAKSVHTNQDVIGFMNPMDTGDDWLPLSKWERKVLRRVVKRKLRKGTAKGKKLRK